jgi:hypothetical protein
MRYSEGVDTDVPEREWNEWLAKLGAFRQNFGHCRVPPKWPGDPGLAKWVAEQRNQFHRLPLERLEELYCFGFDFGAERYWVARFFELLEFKRTHGHCNVPAKWPQNPPLGGWLIGQRARKSSMQVQRRKLFDRIGLDWAPLETAWNRHYQELVAFRQRFGHCNVPGEWAENSQLGIWVDNQRRRKRRLEPLHKRRLNRLGFDWSPAETLWKTHLQELREFQKQNGHCNVPPKYAANPALGSWVTELRQRGKSKVPARWKRRLAALKFDWAPARTQWWETRFAELHAFKEEFGHCRVPKQWPPNPALGDWVSTQRAQRAKLSPSRRARLKELGFDWKVKRMSPAKTWEERFQELADFHKRFGHCDVPGKWPKKPQLSLWVARQRGRDNGNLTPDQRLRLDDLGFCWAVRETNWEQRFSELQAFWEKHGHCDVPRSWSENPGLGGWALRQRYRKETLSGERIRKLDRLGFRWLDPDKGKKRSEITGRFVMNAGAGE